MPIASVVPTEALVPAVRVVPASIAPVAVKLVPHRADARAFDGGRDWGLAVEDCPRLSAACAEAWRRAFLCH